MSYKNIILVWRSLVLCKIRSTSALCYECIVHDESIPALEYQFANGKLVCVKTQFNFQETIVPPEAVGYFHHSCLGTEVTLRNSLGKTYCAYRTRADDVIKNDSTLCQHSLRTQRHRAHKLCHRNKILQ